MSTSMKQKLARYLDAGFPILYINTFEEIKTEEYIRQVAAGRTILRWSLAKGYGEYDAKTGHWGVPVGSTMLQSDAEEAGQAIKHELSHVLRVKLTNPKELNRTVFLIKDAHIPLEDPSLIALLKELAFHIDRGIDCCVMLLSPVIKVPVELEKYITIVENIHLPFEEIGNIIDRFVKDNDLPPLTRSLREDIAVAFKGLTEFEILNILSYAVADDGGLSRKDLQLIFDLKRQLILKSGILEMIQTKESIDDIGGLDNLKQWLHRKAQVIRNTKRAEAFGVDMPKGVLITGVPGCGKSLCAKAAAGLFEVPLLRLDVGKLMGKYLGESEANLRKAIELAEAISPCVLWVDELEKAFAGAGSENSHEVTSRLFGTFLTWMQEKTEAAFVVATANDITRLPPEMLRKGRFDEIFFVGLPKEEERENIFRIHIAKRRPKDLPAIDLQKLVSLSHGYSGADIEGAVKDAVELAFAEDKTVLSTQEIIMAIRDTNSLSVIMKDQIDNMVKTVNQRKLKNASM